MCDVVRRGQAMVAGGFCFEVVDDGWVGGLVKKPWIWLMGLGTVDFLTCFPDCVE